MSSEINTPPFLDPAFTDASPQDWFKQAMETPRDEGMLEADGCPVHYFRWGDATKPSVIMLHGFMAHAHCFAFIAPFLADDYHVVAYDLSGMGDSGHRNERYTPEGRVRELNAVAEHFKMFDHGAKPAIIAHSYGGVIGLAAMEADAARYAGLIIADTMAMRPERLEKFISQSGDDPREERKPNKIYPDYETAKARFVLQPSQSVSDAYLLDYMAYHSLKQTEGGWSWKFDPGIFLRPKRDRAAFMRIGERMVAAPGRKAIIHGEQSKLFNADSAAYLRELGAKFPIIGLPKAGHHLMLDQPIAFTSTLRTVLAHWRAEDI